MGFKKGQSGNPSGKPKGARDKRTQLRDLLEPHRDELIHKAVQLALEGDTTALRLCMERLVAPLRPRDQPVAFGAIPGTLRQQGERVYQAVAEGRLTPGESASIMQALSTLARVIETDELEQRIAALEAREGRDHGTA